MGNINKNKVHYKTYQMEIGSTSEYLHCIAEVTGSKGLVRPGMFTCLASARGPMWMEWNERGNSSKRSGRVEDRWEGLFAGNVGSCRLL